MKTAQILPDRPEFVLTSDDRTMRADDARLLGFSIVGTLGGGAPKATTAPKMTAAEAQQSLFADAVLALPEAANRPRAVAKLLPHYRTMSVETAQGFLRGVAEEHETATAAVDPKAARIAEIRRNLRG